MLNYKNKPCSKSFHCHHIAHRMYYAYDNKNNLILQAQKHTLPTATFEQTILTICYFVEHIKVNDNMIIDFFEHIVGDHKSSINITSKKLISFWKLMLNSKYNTF